MQKQKIYYLSEYIDYKKENSRENKYYKKKNQIILKVKMNMIIIKI